MIIEFTRVLLGLTIALFHGELADFLRKQDHALGAAFRERGVPIPGALPKRVAHDLFFVFGVLIALVSLTRIWMTLR
jgi:hypothetical protein